MINFVESKKTNDLNENSEIFFKIFHSSPTAMSIVRLSDDIILDANERFNEIVGLTRNQVIGETSKSMQVWNDLEDRNNIKKKLFEDGVVKEFDFAYKTYAGEIRQALMFAEIVEFKKEKCALFQALDITERKLAEKQLIEANSKLEELAGERLNKLIDANQQITFETERKDKAVTALKSARARYQEIFLNSPFGIYRCDLSGKLIIANDSFANILKYDSAKSALNHISNIFDNLFVESDKKNILLRDLLSSDNSRLNIELDLICADRSIVTARIKMRLDRNKQGKPNFIEGFVEDITERKLAREKLNNLNAELEEGIRRRTVELEISNKELEAFAYTVSHDLRAPLRAIDGFSQAVLEDYFDAVDDTGKDYLKRIRAASQKMGALIDDILMLSRITRSEMRITDINLGKIAQQIFEELKESEPNRNVKVIIDPDLPAKADPRLIAIALENLIQNAWKYSSKKEFAIIEIGKKFNGENYYYFVKDNGAGFDMRYANKLFQAFNRLHKVEEFEGSGVGLATAARIIRRHGGDIWASSEIDVGSTFYFSLV